ncbi:uncharacterized protein LOC144707689 [Wolffia australiana]
MASFPCSIHAELSSSSVSISTAGTAPRCRLSLQPSSPSWVLLQSSGRWQTMSLPFDGLARTGFGLRVSSVGADGDVGRRLFSFPCRGSYGIHCRIDASPPAWPWTNADRGRRVMVSVNSVGPTSEGDAPSGAAASEGLPEAATRRPGLTAREKLRAARVMSKYSDSKQPPTAGMAPRKSAAEFGSKVLEAMRETDGGKRSGLPEAPSNLLDDSKRGLSKGGFTFDFAGSNDVLLILFSFVFISFLMMATTFLVWKLGAIHFNEY